MAKTFQDLINEGQAKVLGVVSIVPMDDWNADTQYQKLNLVRHNGATYLAKGGSKNVEPGVTQDWQNSWMLAYLDGILSPDGTYPNLTAGRVMHALAWGNKNYDGSSAQTITAADLGLADVYKPQGSITYSALPATPSADNYGYVWNITNDFTTDSRFIEGAGKTYSAGTNVGVIEQDGAYYYDIFGAFVDLSNYAQIDGSYPKLGAGYLAKNGIVNASQASQIGWWKVFSVPISALASISATSTYSILVEVNGVYDGDEGSGSIEINGRSSSSLWVEVNCRILSGNLTPNNYAVVISADGANLEFYAYAERQYTRLAFTVTSEYYSASAVNVINWTVSFLGTSAPSGAVYAVVRNNASTAETANSLAATQLPNDADLNDYVGAEYWGKVFYATGAQAISNSPVAATYVFNLEVLRLSGNTVQVITAGDSSNSSSAPTRYIRYISSNLNYGTWQEIVTADGSYPTLGAGYLAKHHSLYTSAPQAGWLKVGTVPSSTFITYVDYSCIMLIHGIFRGSAVTTPPAPKTAIIEIEVRKYSTSVGDQRIGVIAGDITADRLCFVIEDNLDMSIYLYDDYAAENVLYSCEVISEYAAGSGNNNAVLYNKFEWSTSPVAVLTSAPDGAVYAVNRNVARPLFIANNVQAKTPTVNTDMALDGGVSPDGSIIGDEVIFYCNDGSNSYTCTGNIKSISGTTPTVTITGVVAQAKDGDNKTTYTLTKSGSTITLTGSDGSKTSVTDNNTTYTAGTGLTLNGTTFALETPVSVSHGGTGATSLDGAGIVTKTAAQTISGAKTFTGNNIVKASFSRTAGSGNYKYFDFLDSGNNRLGVIGAATAASSYYGMYMQAGNEGALGIYSNGSSVYTVAPTPAASDDSTKIATTAWVRDRLPNLNGSTSYSGTYYAVETLPGNGTFLVGTGNTSSPIDYVDLNGYSGFTEADYISFSSNTSGNGTLENFTSHAYLGIRWTKTNSAGEQYVTTYWIPTSLLVTGDADHYFTFTDNTDFVNFWFSSGTRFNYVTSKITTMRVSLYDYNT